MTKPAFSRFFLYCAFLAAASTSALADELDDHIRASVAEENRILSTCERRSCPVFYVSALGGRFPIPTRFALKNTVNDRSGRLEFGASVYTTMKGGDLRAALLDAIDGFISILPNEDLDTKLASGAYKIAANETKGPLQVLTLSYVQAPKLLANFPTLKAIKGSDHYVLVIDQNPDLVDNLIRIFFRDNEMD